MSSYSSSPASRAPSGAAFTCTTESAVGTDIVVAGAFSSRITVMPAEGVTRLRSLWRTMVASAARTTKLRTATMPHAANRTGTSGLFFVLDAVFGDPDVGTSVGA